MITIITEKVLIARRISRVVGALQRKVGYYGGNGYCVTWIEDSMPHEQKNIIKNLVRHAEEVIVTTDACWDVPTKRLWLRSLTEKAIRKGMENLQTMGELNAMSNPNPHEQERLMQKSKDVALSAVCRRYWMNQTFESKPFWKLQLDVKEDNDVWQFVSDKQFESKEEAEQLFEEISKDPRALVLNIWENFIHEKAPQLYNLTALQQDANVQYGFSAKKTEQIAQKLFEAGVISYPRTTNRYIPEDVFTEIPKLLRTLRDDSKWGALSMTIRRPNIDVVHQLKPFEHHAIIITGEKLQHPSNDDKKIYDLIARRMLEALSEDCIYREQGATVIAVGQRFTVKTYSVLKPGWRFISGEGIQDSHLPEWEEQQTIDISGWGLTGSKTIPVPLHTEATLLEEMDCGYDHADMIEQLIDEGKIIRLNTQMIPTPKGMAAYAQILKEIYE